MCIMGVKRDITIRMVSLPFSAFFSFAVAWKMFLKAMPWRNLALYGSVGHLYNQVLNCRNCYEEKNWFNLWQASNSILSHPIFLAYMLLLLIAPAIAVHLMKYCDLRNFTPNLAGYKLSRHNVEIFDACLSLRKKHDRFLWTFQVSLSQKVGFL